jgi:hypothetical protein
MHPQFCLWGQRSDGVKFNALTHIDSHTHTHTHSLQMNDERFTLSLSLSLSLSLYSKGHMKLVFMFFGDPLALLLG